MPARLVPLGLTGPPGPVIGLQRPVVLVGRHPECDIRINAPGISRRHCCVAMAYGRTLVRDLGSRNGVRVNGLSVEEAVLRPGDELAIGPFLYGFEDETSPPPRPVPPPAPPSTARPTPSVADDLDDLIPLDD